MLGLLGLLGYDPDCNKTEKMTTFELVKKNRYSHTDYIAPT